MAIAANAAGLAPDRPALHAPLVRTTEIPEVLAPASEGGLLQGTDRIEVVTCLRPPHTPGLAGGVFLVVACDDQPPWDLIRAKGFVVNARGSAALLLRPYHLLGIETLRTIREAARHHRTRLNTGYRPYFDLVARATRDLEAGTRLEAAADGQPLLAAGIQPARPVRGDHPVPLHMALGRRLTTRLAAGQILRTDMLAAPGNSTLWALRQQQDDLFL
jgi:predicted homoserine dehydrogenase-like protein